MVTYWLDFHENIRFPKVLSKYQEQPHPLLYFLIHLKNGCNIRRIFMEQSRNILYSIFPEHYLGIFPRISEGTFQNILGIHHWNVPRIFHEQYSRNIIWEYFPEFHRELFPNILGIYYGNVPRIFHKHIRLVGNSQSLHFATEELHEVMGCSHQEHLLLPIYFVSR